jgi:hypothetical protein
MSSVAAITRTTAARLRAGKAQRRRRREQDLRLAREDRALLRAVRDARAAGPTAQHHRRAHLGWAQEHQVRGTALEIQAAKRRHPSSRLATAGVVPRSRLEPGTVVHAHVAFREADGWKTRPAAVVHVERHDVHVVPITSSRRGRTFGLPVADLTEAGLTRPSAFVRRVVRIDLTDVVDVTGTLHPQDGAVVFELAAHLAARRLA